MPRTMIVLQTENELSLPEADHILENMLVEAQDDNAKPLHAWLLAPNAAHKNGTITIDMSIDETGEVRYSRD